MDNEKLKMHIEPSVVEELADKLYDNKQALIAEIIANSYDADAENIHIQWNDKQIIIRDDGHGMTREEVNNSFLVIGKKRSKENRVSKKLKRITFGSKGIGKLAAIALANKVQITSWIKKDDATSFELDSRVMYSTEGEYNPRENKDEIETETRTGTMISMTEIKDDTIITLKEMSRIIANIFSVVMQQKDFNVYLDCGFTQKYKKIEVRDKRQKYLDHIISFDEKICLPLKFDLSAKDKKANLNYADITESSTVEELIAQEKENNGKSVLEEMINKEILVQNLKFQNVVFPNEKLKIGGWIGTVHSQKQVEEILISDDKSKIIVPIIYDGNVNLVVNNRIGQSDIKRSLTQLSSRFYKDYVVGSIQVDFFDEPNFKGMARSDRQGYSTTDARFKYTQEIIAHLIGLLIRFKDVVKNKRKIGIKETAIKKGNEIKDDMLNALKSQGANNATQKIAVEALAKDSGYKTSNPEKMVFISFRDNENDFPDKVYEACREINKLLGKKEQFEIFYSNSEDTSSYKLYEKLKEKLSEHEVYEYIFSFVVLSPFYINNWYTDIEFGMIHQASDLKSYAFISQDKNSTLNRRIQPNGSHDKGHEKYNDYDLLTWPADGNSLAEIETVFREMITKLKIDKVISKEKLQGILSESFK